MLPKLRRKLEALEIGRYLCLDALATFDPVALNRPPAPDKWSAGQIMAHLILVEQASLQYLTKKLPHVTAESVPQANWRSAWRLWKLRIGLRIARGIQAPPAVAAVPNEVSLVGQQEAWVQTRSALGQLLGALPEPLLTAALYRHPLAGQISLLQMLDFLRFHQAHHLRQIRRLSQQRSLASLPAASG